MATKFKCPECNYVGATKSALSSHSRKHKKSPAVQQIDGHSRVMVTGDDGKQVVREHPVQ